MEQTPLAIQNSSHSRRQDLLKVGLACRQFIDGSSGINLGFNPPEIAAHEMSRLICSHCRWSVEKTCSIVAGAVIHEPASSSFSSCPGPQPE